MKINKHNTILKEDINNSKVEKDNETIQEATNLEEKKIELDLPDNFDIEDASRGDLARMIKQALENDMAAAVEKQTGKDVKVEITDPKLKQEIAQNAADVEKAAELIVNPYGTADISELDKILQNCLETSITNRTKRGLDEPCNLLLYGSAGAGKTAMVRQWCKAHNINMFDCKASSLDVATVGGIPYPVKDDKTGRLSQRPISSSYWDALFKPNTVLFLDEFNRANASVRGTLLSLVNERELPISEDGPDGQIVNKHKFDNLLFTIVAVNPAGDVFTDVLDLDMAEITRYARHYWVKLDPRELLKHINRIFDAILANKLLEPEFAAVTEGQKNLANVLLSDPDFLFDEPTDEAAIGEYNSANGRMISALNYRSFFQNLLGCNGTKADYLAKLPWSEFSQKREEMIKSILKNYTDKPVKGNSVFQKGAKEIPDEEKTAATLKAQKDLSDFSKVLGD